VIPDLGKYAATVLWAYGISLTLLAAIIVLSVRQARRMRRRLDETEARVRHAAKGGRDG